MYVWVARVGSGLRLVGASATRRGRSVFRPIIYNTLGGLASLARRLVNFKKEEILLFKNQRAGKAEYKSCLPLLPAVLTPYLHPSVGYVCPFVGVAGRTRGDSRRCSRPCCIPRLVVARALHFARLVLGIVCRQTHHVFLLSLSSGRRFPNIVSRTRVLSVASD